jgi:regulation of enolase protein 1 (concanavalin A-like superfamily)
VISAAADLPTPWQSGDIGAVGLPGSVSESNGTYSVSGSGADIWLTADAFQYVYQPLAGDGEIIARVGSITNTNGWAKAGLMVRETLAANSKHAMMLASYSSGTALQWRGTTGGSSSHSGSTGNAPQWIRLVRSGNVFTGFKSADGIAWTQVGTATISMSSEVYIGLAVTAHNNAALNTSTFDNVRVGPAAKWPTASLTAPASGALYLGGSTVQLAADASILDGEIAKVQFYANSTLLGESTSAPYTFEWQRAIASNYALTAKAITTDGFSRVSAPVTITVNHPAGNGDGLKANYFADQELAIGPALSRIDPQVNFNWGNGAPDASLPVDRFSVRWAGQLQAQYSETYTISLKTSDGVRLWLGGQLLIDQWLAATATEYSAQVVLVAGQKYDLAIEYSEGTGAASAQLFWSSPMTIKTVIPQSQL